MIKNMIFYEFYIHYKISIDFYLIKYLKVYNKLMTDYKIKFIVQFLIVFKT